MWGQILAGLMSNGGGKSTGNPGQAAQQYAGQVGQLGQQSQAPQEDPGMGGGKRDIYAMKNLDREKQQILNNIAKRFGGGQR